MEKVWTAIGIGAALAVIILALAGVLVFSVHAATATQDQVLRVDATGKVLLRGTITAISGNAFTVQSWGGAWTVNVLPGAQVLPNLTGNDLAGFEVGDYLGAQGTVDQNAAWTIDATLVRDWTYRANMSAEQKQNRASASQTVKSGTPKNYAGVVGGLDGSSFTLALDGTSTVLVVEVAPDAQVTNRNWLFMPLAGVSDGDSVRVWGVNSSGTVAAKIVRDLSLPATSTVQ
jgi:hypothetical protein